MSVKEVLLPLVAIGMRNVCGPSARTVRDMALVERIKKVHAANYSVYGVRKMWHARGLRWH